MRGCARARARRKKAQHLYFVCEENIQKSERGAPKWLIRLLGARVCGGAEEASGGWIGGHSPVVVVVSSPAWRPFSRNASQGVGHADR